MQNDEQEIHNLVSTWMAATRSGDTETVLNLMADDVVWLSVLKKERGKWVLARDANLLAPVPPSGRP